MSLHKKRLRPILHLRTLISLLDNSILQSNEALIVCNTVTSATVVALAPQKLSES